MATFHYSTMCQKSDFALQYSSGIITNIDIKDLEKDDGYKQFKIKLAEAMNPPSDPLQLIVLSLSRIGD